MSAIDRRERPAAGLTRLPEFDLAFLYDDEDDPTEVTIFPAGFEEDLETNWITIDCRHAVPLDRVR